MVTTRSRKRSRSPQEVLQKPRGVIHPRVQKVGPEHFGIVSVDCAKARSKWMFADFYGNVLVPPAEIDHAKPALQAASAQIRRASAKHQILDLIVVVEGKHIAGSFEAVLERLRGVFGKGRMPRALNLVTGPSRSADIEQTLILGAHGPRKLHVIVVEG